MEQKTHVLPQKVGSMLSTNAWLRLKTKLKVNIKYKSNWMDSVILSLGIGTVLEETVYELLRDVSLSVWRYIRIHVNSNCKISMTILPKINVLISLNVTIHIFG